MSDLIPNCQLSDAKVCEEYAVLVKPQKILTRDAKVGDDLTIHRALPHRDRRLIGAWCFLDHFGPVDLHKSGGLNVGPHPHMGLQTFTFLIQGKILHRDSLGSLQMIQPGQVNLMTAGRGIAHSEESVKDHLDMMHGLQLWIALPDAERNMEPDFAHYPKLPQIEKNGFIMTVLAGEFYDQYAPAKVYSRLVGVYLQATNASEIKLPLLPTFEYGILVLEGKLNIQEEMIEPGVLLYFAPGNTSLALQAMGNTRFILIGGEPFKEEVLLWWNFVGRHKSEFTQATADWENQVRFGEVKGYKGSRLTPPPIPWKD